MVNDIYINPDGQPEVNFKEEKKNRSADTQLVMRFFQLLLFTKNLLPLLTH